MTAIEPSFGVCRRALVRRFIRTRSTLSGAMSVGRRRRRSTTRAVRCGSSLCIDRAKAGVDDPRKAGGAQLECQCAGVDTRELEEIVDQQREAVDLLVEGR